MTLRIRQIVFAARDLAATVAQFESALGLRVAFRDPEVGAFGLHNALLAIGDQFLEVVSPIRDNTAAGRHLERHGDSAYMLILQTDDLARDRARLDRLGVRVIWQSDYPDMRAVHLHPKDIGAAIVSLDQPSPPHSWRWAGPDWEKDVSKAGAQTILEATIGAVDPAALAQRWSIVLGLEAPVDNRIAIANGVLNFVEAKADVLIGFRLAMQHAAAEQSVTICGTQFRLVSPVQSPFAPNS
jgi:catechol 2,3-dioxygenase-like lactoylglutathione lyase family enzyme